MIGRAKHRSLWLAAAVLFLPASAAAMDTFMVGPRAMGMGGANVASVSDTTAQYYNPAAFGFFGKKDAAGNRLATDNNNIGRKTFGVDIHAAAGVRLHNDLGLYLDRLADVELERLNDGDLDEGDIADLIRIVGSLRGLDAPGNAISLDATAGLGIRAGRFAIGSMAFMQAAGQMLQVDTSSLGLENDQFALQLGNLDLPDNGATVFSDAQRDRLFTAFESTDATTTQAIRNLELTMIQEGLSQREIDDAVDLLAGAGGLIHQTLHGGGAIEDNTTTVLFTGFGLVEIPLSYGYAINDNLAIGANLKLMRGRVYGNQVFVFAEDSDDVWAQTEENYEESNAFGLDIGVMARFPKVNLGLTGRNLNSPKFDGFTRDVLVNGQPVPLTVEGVKLKPQLTAGAAYIPFQTLTFEINYDLTSNDTILKKGADGAFYQTRNLRLGAEWDAFRFLALRAGAYKNLAEDDMDWVYTAGLGLNLWAARLDVAGAFSTEKETFDGKEIPSETRVAAQFSIDF